MDIIPLRSNAKLHKFRDTNSHKNIGGAFKYKANNDKERMYDFFRENGCVALKVISSIEYSEAQAHKVISHIRASNYSFNHSFIDDSLPNVSKNKCIIVISALFTILSSEKQSVLRAKIQKCVASFDA